MNSLALRLRGFRNRFFHVDLTNELIGIAIERLERWHAVAQRFVESRIGVKGIDQGSEPQNVAGEGPVG